MWLEVDVGECVLFLVLQNKATLFNLQGVTGPHRQNDRDDRHAERIIFCEGTCTRKHIIYELCAGEGVRP